MFCRLQDLKTESDVEQKLLFPLLSAALPTGLGFSAAEVATKLSIRRLEIGKRDGKKLYFPDYIVLLSGFPVLVVEAKAPDDKDLDGALEEARMYAAKLNALFASGINPCLRVIASNGHRLVSSAADSATIDHDVPFEGLVMSDLSFAAFTDAAGRPAMQKVADRLLERLSKHPLHRPVSMLGGQATRNGEIGHNTFGSRLALDFRHVFSPATPEDRAYLVRNAYVRSLRRDRYVEPIDRLIREIVPPGVAHVPGIEDSTNPTEIESVLGRGRSLEHQVMLLVGSVGSGKSTFVDHLVNVALSKELIARTLWLRLDMNLSPVDKRLAEDWVLRQVVGQLKASQSGVDLDELANLLKIYSVEVNRLKKGPLALFDESSNEYRTRLADELLALQRDNRATAQALSRYLCSERSRLLVVVLDNCDKRDLEQQLLMFDVAHWTQHELRCLVILPLRESTYDLHRNEPPLDTAQKDLVFRIEPPRFTEVLSSRIALALKEMEERAEEQILTYMLPNGIKVSYPASDQGMYLTSILRSLYEHDKFLRRILTGLAGRDVRRALELFMEFCSSGHIGEDEIFKIRQMQGMYTLPLPLIARVLLRINRRFYDGDVSYVKNLFQCVPADPRPDHFVRLAILRFLHGRLRKKGPSGIRGYHKSSTVVQYLVVVGHAAERVREEILYLLKARCIEAEHQRLEGLEDDDLIAISSAGAVHLDMLSSLDYLSACAEDCYVSDEVLAERIAKRIGQSRGAHFSEVTVFENAEDFVKYLRAAATSAAIPSKGFLADDFVEDLHDLQNPADVVAATRRHRDSLRKRGRLFIGNIFYETTEGDIADLFSSVGIELADVFIPRDDGGVPKGIAFVTLKRPNELDEAIAKTNGSRLRGRVVGVQLAREVKKAPVA